MQQKVLKRYGTRDMMGLLHIKYPVKLQGTACATRMNRNNIWAIIAVRNG